MAASAHYVFYSWQSDLPASHNRSFIEGAIEEALKQINAQTDVEASPRTDITLDKDTKGVAGSPVITETIVKKIKGCSVFIGDLSFVAQSLPEIVGHQKPVRYVPNPNVAIEYTHALDFHGEERIIAVVNEAYGGSLSENLPFNLRYRRWPIRYALGSQTTPEQKLSVRKKLVAELANAIQSVLDAHLTVPGVASFVGTNFTPTDFRREAQSAELIIDGPRGDDMEPYTIPDRCTICLQLQPTRQVTAFESEGDAYVVARKGHLRPMAHYEISGQSTARNAMGAIAFTAPTGGELVFLSQLFLGKELYGVDAGSAGSASWRGGGNSYPVFNIERVEESYAITLQNYMRFAREMLGLPTPWRIIARVYGMQNYTVGGRRCLRPEFHWSVETDSAAPVLEILNPCFTSLWKMFTVTRPDEASSQLEELLRFTAAER